MAELRFGTEVADVRRAADGSFAVETSQGPLAAPFLAAEGLLRAAR